MKFLDQFNREANASTGSLVSTGANGWKEGETTVATAEGSSCSSVVDDDSLPESVDNRFFHEAGVKSQYDTQDRLVFYKEVMGDGTGNIHFGKWDGVDMDAPGAYGQASEQMTDYMYELALRLRKKPAVAAIKESSSIRLVDLGSGTGSAARRLAQFNPNLDCTCLNLCETQNALNQELCQSLDLNEQVHVCTGTYEEAPFDSCSFDIVFSQDALIHSFSKRRAYMEAKRIARPGAVFVFSDLMAGEQASPAELESFASTNMVKDWMTPSQNVACLHEVGFRDVTFVDLTADIKLSFTGMLQKVNDLLQSQQHEGIDQVVLETYQKNLTKRIDQCDRHIFSWGVIHVRKAAKVAIYPTLPVRFQPRKVEELIEHCQGPADDETDAIVVDFTTRVDEEMVRALPEHVSLIVTLSSGKDHIACDAAARRGIHVASSDKRCITQSVAEYGLSLIISGLRNIFGNIGTRFPGKDWTLCWNCQGVSLDQATLGMIGMGDIATLLVTKLRALSSTVRIRYYEPEQFRNLEFEKQMNLEYCDSPEQVADCPDLDIFMPLAPLLPATQNLVNASLLSKLPEKCGLINLSRGPVVDQAALVAALQSQQLQYAILDATTPEPLPEGHALLGMDNVFILPHFATNTMEVRQKLVDGIEDIVSEHYQLE